MGPNPIARRFTGYVINGYRYHTKFRDSKCTTQNSGVFLTALTTSFASSKDENPITSEVSYYGAVEDILEIDYYGEFSVVLFKCCWYHDEKELYGLTRVNFNRLRHKSDPYVMASQVQQVFYIEDPVEKGYYNVIKKLPRDWSDNENVDETPKDPISEDILHGYGLGNQVTGVNWCREDVPVRKVRIPPSEHREPAS